MSGVMHEHVSEPSRASVAARLCWEVAQLCRAMDAAAEQLHIALVEAAEHANAVIEIALLLGGSQPGADADTGRRTPANH